MKPTPEMLLLEFAREHYMTMPHHNSGKIATRQLRYKLDKLVSELTIMLNRTPTVADLTLENCDRLPVALRGEEFSYKSIAFFVSLFKAMLRHAAELGLVELPDVLLPQTPMEFNHTGAANTLWALAQKQLFPRRVSIGSETQRQYRYAIADFGRFLGHDPVAADLDDDILVAYQKHLIERRKSTGGKLSAWTINERVGRLRALWTFLAQRRIVEQFPTVLRLKIPELIPKAFTQEQLAALFKAADEMPGRIGGVIARHWWQALIAFVLSTGERKGATLALRWDWIDFKGKLIIIPAEVRKGRQKNGIYELWPEVAKLLERIRKPVREVVFPDDRNPSMYWKDWDRILKLAGLPGGPKSKTQGLRISHASFLKMMGGDPTAALMHGDAATTIKHYLDPRLGRTKKRLLPARWEAADEPIAVEMSASDAKLLPRARLVKGGGA